MKKESKQALSFDNVTVNLGETTILEKVSFSLGENEFLGVIGPNGGGKTTLLKTILGLIKPVSGKVMIFGMPPEKGRKLVGYVPQTGEFDWEFPVNVWDVVIMGRRKGLFRRYGREDREACRKALERVDMLELKDRQIGMLSGGQKQRVLIARALVSNPKMLLLDEPTASIDKYMETKFYGLVKSLKKDHAIILVSHDVGAVSAYVDSIACLNRRFFYHGTKEITDEELKHVYKCPIDLIAHGVPHRVLKKHNGK